ncbi:MAG TPA: hypothetical protein VFQ05_02320 [Candidatus Eisenbacteria bacterium]|nr:hypothetical protein [Candidatus Eisenbacteria bacterium]
MLNEVGFTLVEAITATVIAIIAVLGLAFSFSAGRGMIDRYAVARSALASAERRMEYLSILGLRSPTHPDLSPGVHPPSPLSLNGNTSGTEQWTVTPIDDPADADSNPDYKQVVVDVSWMSGSVQDKVVLTRIILGS